jgi:hypothetical protein
MRLVLRVELELDEEEYTIPADGELDEALLEDFRAALWDFTGLTVKRLRVVSR